MSARPVIHMLLAACVVCSACDATNLTKFDRSRTPPPSPTFASLEVLPNSVTVEQGLNAIVDIIPRDDRGERMVFADAFTVTSSAPEVATINSSGIVTGLAPGVAELTVSKTERGLTRTAMVTATILPANSLVFDLKADLILGWQPSVASVTVGRTVRWVTTRRESWSGDLHNFLYLLNDSGVVLDSLDLSTLSATRTFRQPGVYNYCSASCYDTPDFGVILVR